MTAASMMLRYGLPGLGAFGLVSIWASSYAQQTVERVELFRIRNADGTNVARVDLAALTRFNETVERHVRKALDQVTQRIEARKASGHSAGIPGCRRATERRIDLAQAVPERLRSLDLYFVAVPREGARPTILPQPVPEATEIFVLSAQSLDDVAELSRRLGRRLTLTGADFARAVGVTCMDAHVTFSRDGRRATVREVAP